MCMEKVRTQTDKCDTKGVMAMRIRLSRSNGATNDNNPNSHLYVVPGNLDHTTTTAFEPVLSLLSVTHICSS